ncbi:class I adenylate-forming enzyme family protein [Prescottella agglutinans]|uniref:Fatty-acyl-CoA synthase n=1 Tax=Prescottella agglutinans TaxID=1644129 RepID=A0ABT6MEB4_9NOCA|nr:class I adenylate-forming enzyme family protein [Prescottella agglutinans]MDH6282641.1 fatty-acyl-CoA synthase [Prescottella agglutinans]
MTSALDIRTLAESLWPVDDSVPLVDQTVGDVLRERAREFGDRTAVVGVAHGTGETRRLTYTQLHDEASRVANALLRLARPGDFVALWAPNVVEWPIVMFGAALAGVRLVALNPVLREDELVYALDHSGSTTLIHADASRGYDMAAVVAAAAPRCDSLAHVVSLSETDRWIAAEPLDPAAAGPDASDADAPVMLQYTSGTTGLPKGVLLRHRSLVNVARFTLEGIESPPNPVAVNPLPMFHTASCVIGTLGTIWMGGTMILIEQFTPAGTLKALRDEGASVFYYVPTILGAVLEAARTSPEPAPKVLRVLGGGANVPGPMIEATEDIFGATVHNLYGQTELAPVLTLTRTLDSRGDQVNTSGRPIPQVEVKIVDPVDGTLVPLGESGEICARGFQQMIEYLGNPEATAATVDRDGWLHTGDLGAFDSRGTLRITGRLKDLIIRGGENVAPAEVESCLIAHDGVLQVAVVGVDDEKWGEAIAAVVVPRGNAAPGLRQSLIDHCTDRLSKFKVPRDWYLASELPTTPSGKIQKFRLRDTIMSGDVTSMP